jgi:hypothetical protein
MAIETARSAPYAPIASVLAVIRRLRERSLPEVLNLLELSRVGVSEGNASRTLQALRFFGLIDDDGRRTPLFDRLGRAATAEYPQVLADILRESYAEVFRVVGDPASANEVDVNDAFRGFKPEAQRNRMVVLFIGLCREAGLMPGGPLEARPRSKKPAQPRIPPRKEVREPVPPAPSNGSTMPDFFTGALDAKPATAGADYSLLALMLRKLPASGQWSPEERQRWLATFIANLDFLAEVVDSEDDG